MSWKVRVSSLWNTGERIKLLCYKPSLTSLVAPCFTSRASVRSASSSTCASALESDVERTAHATHVEW